MTDTRSVVRGIDLESRSARVIRRRHAIQRRALRRAVIAAGVALVGVEVAYAAGLALISRGESSSAVLINLAEAAAGILAVLLVLGPARRHPLAVAFPLAMSLVLPTLQLLAFAPEFAESTLVGMVLVPVSVALFMPWPARVHALWFAWEAGILIVYQSTALGAAITPERWQVFGLMFAISGAVSLAGCALLERGRRDSIDKRLAMIALRARSHSAERAVRRLNTELATTARSDSLTGLGNRMRLDEDLAATAEAAQRYGRPYAIAIFDLDDFKAINDVYGHAAGDEALRRIGALIRSGCRGTDRAYRFGGEEFVVLMPEQSIAGAHVAAERIRAAVERAGIPSPSPKSAGRLTISAGVAAVEASDMVAPDDLLSLADAALYAAKRAGKNRVVEAPVHAAGPSARAGTPVAQAGR